MGRIAHIGGHRDSAKCLPPKRVDQPVTGNTFGSADGAAGPPSERFGQEVSHSRLEASGCVLGADVSSRLSGRSRVFVGCAASLVSLPRFVTAGTAIAREVEGYTGTSAATPSSAIASRTMPGLETNAGASASGEERPILQAFTSPSG